MGVFYKSITSSSGCCLLLLSSVFLDWYLLLDAIGFLRISSFSSGFLGFLRLLRNFRNTSPLLLDLALFRVSFPFIYPRCGFSHTLLSVSYTHLLVIGQIVLASQSTI